MNRLETPPWDNEEPEQPEPIRVCPACGGKTRYYHGPEGISRVVCKGECPEWTVIKTIDFNKLLKDVS